MRDFHSLNSYFRFAFAKEFIQRDQGIPFSCQNNTWESTGEWLVKPLLYPGDYILKNIRKPFFVTATVIAGLALTTLVFYPAFVPGLILVAHALKLAAYLLTQTTIVGVGIRTLGRLQDQKLMVAWKNREIMPINLGTEIIRL